MSRTLAGAALVVLGTLAASVYWTYHSEPVRGVDVAPLVAHTPWTAKPSARVEPASVAPVGALTEQPQWAPALVERVAQKYRWLFEELRPPPTQLAQLRELLREQQRLRDLLGSAAAPDSAQALAARTELERALAAIDARVRALLDPARYARYEALRESDVEQDHLAQYRGGVSALAPLSPQQERLILDARLRHKKHYEAGMRDLGLERTALSVAERLYAHRSLAQALNEYRDSFLAEVRPSLSEDQYFLLSSYETTEFARELERLQIVINGK